MTAYHQYKKEHILSTIINGTNQSAFPKWSDLSAKVKKICVPRVLAPPPSFQFNHFITTNTSTQCHSARILNQSRQTLIHRDSEMHRNECYLQRTWCLSWRARRYVDRPGSLLSVATYLSWTCLMPIRTEREICRWLGIMRHCHSIGPLPIQWSDVGRVEPIWRVIGDEWMYYGKREGHWTYPIRPCLNDEH